MEDHSTYIEILKYAFYLIGTLAALGVGETLLRLRRMEKKQDEQRSTHEQCRLTLMSKQEFGDWETKVFSPWKIGRDGPEGLWDVINHHSHQGIDGDGKVVRK